MHCQHPIKTQLDLGVGDWHPVPLQWNYTSAKQLAAVQEFLTSNCVPETPVWLCYCGASGGLGSWEAE